MPAVEEGGRVFGPPAGDRDKPGDFDAQSKFERGLLGVCHRRQHQGEGKQYLPSVHLRRVLIAKESGAQPDRHHRRDGKWCLAVGSEEGVRQETGIERNREEQAECGLQPADFSAPGDQHARHQRAGRTLQRDIEEAQRIRDKSSVKHRRQIGHELGIVGGNREEGIALGAVGARKDAMVEEIGGIGQEVQPGICLARPHLDHDKPDSRAQHDDPPQSLVKTAVAARQQPARAQQRQ